MLIAQEKGATKNGWTKLVSKHLPSFKQLQYYIDRNRFVNNAASAINP